MKENEESVEEKKETDDGTANSRFVLKLALGIAIGSIISRIIWDLWL